MVIWAEERIRIGGDVASPMLKYESELVLIESDDQHDGETT